MGIVAVLRVPRFEFAPLGFRQFPVATQAFLAEGITIGGGIEAAQAERQRGLKQEQTLGQPCRLGSAIAQALRCNSPKR